MVDFYQISIASRNTEIQISSNFWLETYVLKIFKDKNNNLF